MKPRRIGLRLVGILLLLWVLLPGAVIVALRWLPPPTSAFMLQQRFNASKRPVCPAVEYQWRSWDQLSPVVALAVIAAEDQRFPEHNGFDIPAIRRAWKANKNGKRIRGASTISQQVAKNLFLWPGHSWLRKGLEVGLTLWIELIWPKQRILEVYLNIAQWGACLFGVEAASQRYFGRNAARLTLRQASLLAAVLPNPVRFQVDQPTSYIRKRRNWIMRQSRQLGGVDYLQRLYALSR